jgi:hypothetical protein
MGRGMSRRIRMLVVLVAVLALWAGFAWTVTRPDDFADYSRTVGQVAGSAHDAARTGWLTGRQELDGRVTKVFATTAYDDAEKTLAGAQQQFTTAPPDDARAVSLRDQLGPLVTLVVRDLGDAAGAPDRTALADAVSRLDLVARQLEEFIQEHR